MLRLPLICLLLVPSISTAQDHCPTGDDVRGSGVVFGFDDGSEEVHALTAPNVITMDYTSPDYQGQSLYAYGVYALSYAETEDGHIVDGSVWVFSYVAGNDTLPEPQPNGSWESQSVYSIDGGGFETEFVRQVWGPLTSVSIGSCTYDALLVSIQFDGESYDHIEEVLYLPALGTGVLTAYEDDTGRDEYTPVSIGRR